VFGLEPRILRALWTILLFVLIMSGLYALRELLLMLVLSLFVAYLLAPLLDFTDRWLSRYIPRETSLAILYIAGLTAVSFAAAGIAAAAGEEAVNLARRLPQLMEHPELLLQFPLPGWLEQRRPEVLEFIRSQLQGSVKEALPLLQTAGSSLLSGLGSAGIAILIPIFSFYFLKDGKELTEACVRGISRYLPEDRVRSVALDLHLLLSQYIRSILLLSISVFTAYLLFFELTGAPFGILLATVAALTEVVPVAGPLLGMVLAVVTCAVNGYQYTGWMILFFLAFRLVQDYVILPRVMSSGITLHPVLIIGGIIAGEKLMGIPGMLLSIPLMATIRILYLRLRR
jgi:predicted PurR-regulated permease PerM